MIKKILLIGLFAVLLPLALFGAKNIPKEEYVEELSRADVISRFTQLNAEITADLKKPDSVNSVYWQNTNTIKRWMKDYRFIELDTEIDRSWYEKAAKLLAYMDSCKSFLANFIRKDEINQSAEYQQVLANLKAAHKQFAQLLKNPTPVDQKKLEKLREEKHKSDRAR